MITAVIDTSRANDLLSGLREAMIGKGMDGSKVVEDEVKQLSKTIVNFTPPLGPGGRSAGAKQAGEAAIDRENKNLISVAKPGFLSWVSQRWGIQDVGGYVESKTDKRPLRLNFGTVDLTGDRLSDIHGKYRNKRGKIPLEKQPSGTWTSRVLAPDSSRSAFITTLQSRIGLWKATWAYCGFRLGAKFPSWISRHFASVGGLAIANLDHLKDPVRPYAIIGSRFPGGLSRIQFVRDAVRVRMNAIRRKMRLILADYKADVVRGIKAESSARKHGETEPTVE